MATENWFGLNLGAGYESRHMTVDQPFRLLEDEIGRRRAFNIVLELSNRPEAAYRFVLDLRRVAEPTLTVQY